MTKTTETTTALSLKGITAGYGRTTIVRNIDLNIKAGSVTALLGPNGAGKSTLLKTMSGLIRPMSGSVLIDGHDVSSLAPNKRANLGLCHITEGRGIFPSMTVKENLELQAKPGEQSIAIEKGIAAFPILGERLMQRA